MAMKMISVTDIEGFKLGNAENSEKGTGCTVIICEDGAVGGVDVRGGGPATRETDLLRSENTVDTVNAVVLSGGSAFGLEAASGVMRELAEQRIGYDVGDDIVVPIVCGASLYDLPLGDPKTFPDVQMGIQAVHNAFEGIFDKGNHGAGTGASVGKMKGYDRAMKSGLGTFACGDGFVEVGAIAAVNAVGDVYNGAGNIIAGLRSEDGRTIFGTIKTLKNMVHDQIKPVEESASVINKYNLDEALAAAAKQYEHEKAVRKLNLVVPAEESAEKIAEEPAEEITEEPVREIVWETAEETADEAVEEHSGETIEEPFEDPLEDTVEKAPEELVEETAEAMAEETAEETFDVAIDEPAEEFLEESSDELVEDTADGIAEEPLEDTAEEPVEEFIPETPEVSTYDNFREYAEVSIPVVYAEPESQEEPEEEPVEECSEEPYGEFAEEPAEEFIEESAEEIIEEPAEEFIEEPAEEFPEESAEEFIEEPAEEFPEESAEEFPEESAEEFIEEPAEEFIEEPAEEIIEEPAEEIIEEPAEEFKEEPAEEYAEEHFEEFIEESVEDIIEEHAEMFSEETVEADTEEEPVVLTREEMGYDIIFNTTISCLITNAALTKSQANKLASILHDAYARAIKPVHGTLDGDTVFVLATGKQQVNFDAFAALATDVMQYAIIDGAMSAEGAYGLPAARDMQKSGE